MARPKLEDVLGVIQQATPLLEQLKAEKITLDNYINTAQEYKELAEIQQAKVDSTVVSLQAYADALVALYKTAETEVV